MEERNFASSFDQQRAGFARRLLTKGQGGRQFDLLRSDPATFAAYRYPTDPYPSTTWEHVLAQAYGKVAFDLAFAQQTGGGGDTKLAERMYRNAIRLNPDDAPAYKNLGLVLRSQGGDRAEIVTLWRRFLALKPDDPQAGAIRAELAKLEQQP
jgi:tetratricopeptide (TPR) repeat protein